MERPELVAYVGAHGDAVVSTSGPRGEPQAAYLSIAATTDGELVFTAMADSRKVANIRRDNRIAVVIGGPDQMTLQLQGTTDVPMGRDRERCEEAYLAAFPQFASSMVDDSKVLVRVTLEWSRFGDYR